jgi:hypothetical protein
MKPYVKPASCFISLCMNENIAASADIETEAETPAIREAVKEGTQLDISAYYPADGVLTSGGN